MCPLLGFFFLFFLVLKHISREDIVGKHITDYGTRNFSYFLSDSVISMMDGTYICTQKRRKYAFKRHCFSVHKHRPLVKAMVATATDGYIISILGPFYLTHRSSNI